MIETQLPEPPAGPAKQLLSVDGAMVPLVGGEWTEVKTLVLGEIDEPVRVGENQVVESHALTYFSRPADAETFQHLALVETHRRGVETAAQVIAPTDGAVWIQGFLDYHRPNAQRILDFGHAAEYVSVIGTAPGTPESPAFAAWLNVSLHTLKHEGATALLPELRTRVACHPDRAELAEALAYLEKRTAMMNYPEFQRQGWPIGSGSVESGNKVVVEARLKGAGMHWARPHVNPMLSLRNAVCSERWDEAWQDVATQHHQQRRQRFLSRAQRNTRVPLPPPLLSVAPTEPATVEDPPAAGRKQSWQPAGDHPWRRSLGPLPSRRPRSAEI
ncbi:MAG: hypothetical protein MUQ10_14225 [Anaerolineae bacterium]|nr:hypothetical protein [Anaerolineae bacterium]